MTLNDGAARRISQRRQIAELTLVVRRLNQALRELHERIERVESALAQKRLAEEMDPTT